MNSKQHHYSFEAINDMPQRYRANFINSLSGFKSASLLGTTNEETHNLAVISSVVHIGANPPLLGVIMRPHTVQRDSLQNIKQRGVYTLNHIATNFTDKAHQTSARYDYDVSEFKEVGLTPWFSGNLSAPYVEESAVKMGLRVEQHTILCNETKLVIGRIEEVFLNSGSHIHAVKEDGYVDLETLNSACISGLDSYHATTRVARYQYAKPDTDVKRCKV